MNPGPWPPRRPARSSQGSARGTLNAQASMPVVESREDRGVVCEGRGHDEEVEDLVRRKEVIEGPGRESFRDAVGAVVWCRRRPTCEGFVSPISVRSGGHIGMPECTFVRQISGRIQCH